MSKIRIRIRIILPMVATAFAASALFTAGPASADPVPSGCMAYTVGDQQAIWASCARGSGYVMAGAKCRTSGGATQWFWGNWVRVPNQISIAHCSGQYSRLVTGKYTVTGP